MKTNDCGCSVAAPIQWRRKTLPIATSMVALLAFAACGGGNSDPVNPSGNATANRTSATIVSTVTTGVHPEGLALDTAADKVYVSFFGIFAGGHAPCGLPVPGGITEIDGATNVVAATTSGGPYASAIALNPARSTVYLISPPLEIINPFCHTSIGGELAIYNAATLSASASFYDTLGGQEFDGAAMVVDTANDKLYISNQCCSDILVVDGATNTLTGTIAVPAGVGSNLAIDSSRGKLYVTGNGLSIVDIATAAVATFIDPNALNPGALAINSQTNKIYVSNALSNNISIFDGATASVKTITDPNAISPAAIAVNQKTNKIYIVNTGSNNVTVLDGATNAVTTIAAGTSPIAMAVDAQANFIYVANNGNTSTSDPGSITVINGLTNGTGTLTDPKAQSPTAVAVNPNTHMAYVANYNSNNVTVIAGPT